MRPPSVRVAARMARTGMTGVAAAQARLAVQNGIQKILHSALQFMQRVFVRDSAAEGVVNLDAHDLLDPAVPV